MEEFEKLAGSPTGSVSLQGFMNFIRDTFSGTDKDPDFEKRVLMIFNKFSMADSELMYSADFARMWDTFLKRCMRPKSALIVVDFQYDFIDGSLSLKKCPRGEDPKALIPGLNRLIDLFDHVVYTKDWHPEGHISFLECLEKRKLHESCTIQAKDATLGTEVIFNIGGNAVKQKLWPRHCVQGSQGAQLHKDLKIKPDSITIHKGTDIDVDSYSAFWDNERRSRTGLTAALRKRSINNVFIVGLAYDACVSWTALDAVSEGFTTTLIRDLTCAICDEMCEEADSRLKAAGCPLINAAEIANKKTLTSPVSWSLVWQQAGKLC